VSEGWSKLGSEVGDDHRYVLFIGDCPHGIVNSIELLFLQLTSNRMAL
jgi:hypothetical protein